MRRVLLHAAASLLAAFLLLPVLAILPAAFGARSYLELPPSQWSLHWWGAFFADPSWRNALVTSLALAAATSLIAVVAGTSAALGLARLRRPMRALCGALVLGPAVVPAIVLAVALYGFALRLGLAGTFAGLAVAHAMLALPYAVLTIGVSLSALDPRLPQAAAGLGADHWRVFRTVTLPLIAPGVAAAAVFGFVTSFDEVVLSIFLAGPEAKTLPVRMWEEIRVELTPVTAVAAAVMILLALAAGALGQAARRWAA
jgi:putative spermidine/putrescine transport system permease protein